MGKASRRKRERSAHPSSPDIPSVEEVLREQRDLFRRKFGRDMGPDDPVFFDPDADTPRRLQVEPMEAAMTRGMKEVGTPPEFIYAFEKTGRLVTSHNLDRLSKEALAEWEAAVDEYFRKRERGELLP